MSQTFQITGADGQTIQIPAGEFYFNTKARTRRMMTDSLSSEARQVYACLELATMGFQQELAVIMERGKRRPLAPVHLCQQTGLSKQNVRRALVELEDEGLAERRGADDGPLQKGKVEIYSWAEPRKSKIKNGSRARLPFPEWFPDSWFPLKSFITRYKYKLPAEIPGENGGQRATTILAEGEQIAQDYQKLEMVVTRFLDGVCARERPNKEERTERAIHKEPSSSAFTPNRKNGHSAEAPKAEEEEDFSYQKFKAKYPTARFDEPKAKASFQKKTKAQQKLILERLDVYLVCERWKDEGGRWIPLASNWLESYEAEPPPRLTKPSRGRRLASSDELAEYQRMKVIFNEHASEINEILRAGGTLPKDWQEALDYMGGER